MKNEQRLADFMRRFLPPTPFLPSNMGCFVSQNRPYWGVKKAILVAEMTDIVTPL